ncbi:MAG: hypothetical protein NT080_05470 [Spirochaetes bacterium]|nr:hypothetical protein [Spirochaetota bacterium]
MMTADMTVMRTMRPKGDGELLDLDGPVRLGVRQGHERQVAAEPGLSGGGRRVPAKPPPGMPTGNASEGSSPTEGSTKRPGTKYQPSFSTTGADAGSCPARSIEPGSPAQEAGGA